MRERRKWTQGELARRAGLGRTVIGRAERGEGRLDLETLERIGLALGVAVVVSFSRDIREDVADAGHLAMQELVLRRARTAGYTAQFELATRPNEPWRSIDVAFGSDSRRVAVEIECWNTFGDLGAASRSSSRKLAELEQIAAGRWGEDARAAMVWVVRDTARNRALVARYPEIFANRFPGSSRAWVEALTVGDEVPLQPDLVWCDVGSSRLYAWRRSSRPRAAAT